MAGAVSCLIEVPTLRNNERHKQLNNTLPWGWHARLAGWHARFGLALAGRRARAGGTCVRRVPPVDCELVGSRHGQHAR